MDGRFLEAFTLLPRQRVVCGRVTKPLCLRHRIVLESIKSPFVNGSDVPSPTDVLIFSKVVSSYDMAEMMPDKPSEDDSQWVMRMTENREALLHNASEAFETIQDQSKWPVFWNNKKNGSKSNGVPWALAVVCNLVKNGVPLEQAWTMPESQAIWMNAGFAIASGADINIVSEEDLAMQAFLEKLEADKKAKEDAESMEELSNV